MLTIIAIILGLILLAVAPDLVGFLLVMAMGAGVLYVGFYVLMFLAVMVTV